MKTLKYLVAAFLLILVAEHACAQPIDRNNYWQHFVEDGANTIQTWLQPWDANSVDLGSNIAGYDMGRYGLHSLMWGHLAWVRSPEYADPSTTDTQRRLYLQSR